MSDLSNALTQYLAMRRTLGQVSRLLHHFVAFVDEASSAFITTDLVCRWAVQPADAQPSTWAGRLVIARRFAIWRRASDENDILVQQILAHLSPDERDLCYWKAWGHSTREIARACGKSAGYVNTLVYRTRLKIRDLLRSTETGERGNLATQPTKPRTV